MNLKQLLTLLITCAATTTGFSAISPEYKEVLQRGYEMQGDSVILPDGSKCRITDFNRGACGKEWFDRDYCVPEGGMVWDESRCCEGLEAYLEEGIDGQQTCRKKRGKSSGVQLLFYTIVLLLLIFFWMRWRAKKIRTQTKTRFGRSKSSSAR